MIHQPGEVLHGLPFVGLGVMFFCQSLSTNSLLRQGKSAGQYVVLSLLCFIIGSWHLLSASNFPHHKSQMNITIDRFTEPLAFVLLILAALMELQRIRKNKMIANDATKRQLEK